MSKIIPYPRGDLVDFLRTQPEDFYDLLHDDSSDLTGLWHNMNPEMISEVLSAAQTLRKTEDVIYQVLYRIYNGVPSNFPSNDEVGAHLMFVAEIVDRKIDFSPQTLFQNSFTPSNIYAGCLDEYSFYELLNEIIGYDDKELTEYYLNDFKNPRPRLLPAMKTARAKFCKSLLVLWFGEEHSAHQRLQAKMELLSVELDNNARVAVSHFSDIIEARIGMVLGK